MSRLRLALVGLLVAVGYGPVPANAGDAATTSSARLGAALSSAWVGPIELHYEERGKGEPIVFVHGSLVDYAEWGPVARQLEDRYRTIAYSRRYNYPNTNSLVASNHSAAVESEDLAGLIGALQIGPVHLVGVSYGAYTALLTTIAHPNLVRSLTIVEPPLMKWAPGLPGGQVLSDDFFTMWSASRAAFEGGDPAAALHATLQWFVGDAGIAQLSAADREVLTRNLLEWRALALSSDAFPPVTAEQVHAIDVPVLMISGARSYAILRLIDAEIEQRLAHGTRLIVGDGTHDVCSEQPVVCAQAIAAFLAKLHR